MAFEIKIIDGDDGVNTIVGLLDGVEVWRSITPDTLDPACTLNVDYPTITDERTSTPTSTLDYRVPDVTEATVLRMDAEQHRVAATYAAVVGAATLKDAAAATELPPGDLVAEAQAWAVASLSSAPPTD